MQDVEGRGIGINPTIVLFSKREKTGESGHFYRNRGRIIDYKARLQQIIRIYRTYDGGIYRPIN